MLNCTIPVGTVVAGATGLTVAVYVPDVVPTTTAVVELAWSMVKVFESLLAVWLASPAKLALAVAVPALVLLE
jgi:hypothetical protein